MSWLAVPLAGVTVLSTLAGGFVALRLARDLATAIALTGGVVVAVALFQVLPEAIEAVDDPHRVGLLVGAGFVFFFLAERALVLHHRDEPEQARAHARVGALGAAGLSVHSFIDGLGIGLAFGLDTTTGLLVFLAVVSHDFADGLNTVSFVMRQSGDRRTAVRWLAVDAAAPLVGADRRRVALRRRGAARRAARRLRRLLPLHGRDRPPAARARASVREARAPHRRRLRRHPPREPPSDSLRLPYADSSCFRAKARKRARASSSGPRCSSSP